MPKTHKLVLVNEKSLLPKRFTKEESAEVWNNFGPDKTKESFSWANEDYRQSVVNQNIENAIPKEEDFLPFPFRHLSATIVGGGSWKATDFPEKVLKASTKMLSNKPVYVNHELEISNIVAGIGQTKWTPSFKMEDGTIVPGGIDAPIWVDGKLHPDICRKLAAFPVPHIQSVSVTVVFEWEPSHVFENRDGVEDLWLFEMRIGQMVDGEMVRRVATKIIEYYETSFVWLGADPFAKILDAEGKPLNIEKSAIVGLEHFDKDPLCDLYKNEGKYFVTDSCISNDKKLDLVKRVYLNKSNFGKEGNQKLNKNNLQNLNNQDEMKDKVIQLLALRLSIKPEEVTEELMATFELVSKEDHTSLTGLKTKVGSLEAYNTLVTEKDKFKVDLEASQAIVDGNKPLVEFANSTLESAKENTLKYYRLGLKEGATEDEAAIALIDRAVEEKDFDTLNTLAKQYGGEALETLGASCNDCESKNITFRTTEESDDLNKEDKGQAMPNLSKTFRHI